MMILTGMVVEHQIRYYRLPEILIKLCLVLLIFFCSELVLTVARKLHFRHLYTVYAAINYLKLTIHWCSQNLWSFFAKRHKGERWSHRQDAVRYVASIREVPSVKNELKLT